MINRSKMVISLVAGSTAAMLTGRADARVISNIASISWDGRNGPASLQSNQVDITVATAPISAAIFSINADGAGTMSRIDGPGCTTAGGTASGVIGTRNINTNNQVALTPSNRFTAGAPIVFGVTSAADNRDATVREHIDVVVRTDTGDSETLRLVEDAPDSGFFVGYLTTVRMPPAIVNNDCHLSVIAGQNVQVTLHNSADTVQLSSANVSFLVDPFGIVFDSGDGAPVAGARVTLIDESTGQPAQVFGDDGVSAFPNSVVTGSTVTDSGGTIYNFPTGDYRFPFVAPGAYRLRVETPVPYRWPSAATAAQLASYRRPDNGEPYTITTASYGAVFQLFTPAPVRIDVPIDRPGAALSVRKTSSSFLATPGETLQYRIIVTNSDPRRNTGAVTVRDDLPRSLRLRANSIRYNGTLITPTVTPDGRHISLNLPALAPGQSGLITYLAEVRPDAQPGDATNIAAASDDRGTVSNIADASIRIQRDLLGDRITVIGQITGGGCGVDPAVASGIGGVRVLMEDGSFTVTDSEGRYHFEGVRPGLHVVQIDPNSAPQGQEPVDCTRNTASAGSAISRFVTGRGGELKRADFHFQTARDSEGQNSDGQNSGGQNEGGMTSPTTPTLPTQTPARRNGGADNRAAQNDAPRNGAAPANRAAPAPVRPTAVADDAAAGATIDHFAGQAPGIAWLFPTEDHNPRSPAIRVAIKHLPGQRVELTVNGAPIDPLNFDGARPAPNGAFMVSTWRGIEIDGRDNRLVARVLNADGSLAQELQRTVHYADSPIEARLVAEQSLLVADGLRRPVVAVRLTDRDGRPVKNGATGEFAVLPPHRAAREIDAEQSRQLAGLERRSATWHVVDDNGLAYIELDPTTASGTARITFTFRDRDVVRAQQLDVWLNPGNQPWTVVGYAAGTVGFNSLDDHPDFADETLDGDTVDGRTALYAKGPLSDDWQVTLSYDSDKEKDEARFGGTLDPRAYYTIFADRADRGFDASSVRNLYLRLERSRFYALFGDFETGINETLLTGYQRSLNGGKFEYRGPTLAATGFVADTPYRYRRDEVQGNGLSGPYQLGARGILANSERVTIEVRDRLRSDQIVERKTLTRHIDYDIDYFAGTLRFRQPILSRDTSLNPQFIIVDYEVDGVGQRVTNAGGRVSLTGDNQRLRVGATLIHDESDTTQSNMGGLDLRYRPDPTTEIRAEVALSETTPSNGATATSTGTRNAWLVEAEHHSALYDVLVYAREREAGFGVGQLSSAGDASRRFGFDGKLRIGRDLSLTASGWQEEFLSRDARRRAARLLAEWRTQNSSIRAGLTHADDRLGTGESNVSNIIQLGATQRLAGGRVEVDAQTEFALGHSADSVDFPTRHRLGARYALTQDVSFVGAYEIARGGTVDARTVQAGFDVKPWSGGRLVATGNQQDINEFGPRSFAAYGLTQSFQVSEHISIDATVDGQRTLNGIRARDVLDPAHPVASGGFLGGTGAITEDFTAVTLGATYRDTAWSIATRGEYRKGEIADRYGLTIGAIRRIGEGRAFGGLLTWTEARSDVGASTRTIGAEASWAHRPATSRWSFLEKLELRHDSVRDAVAGQPGPIGGTALNVTGDQRSNRIINSLSINYTPQTRRDGIARESGEYALFWGVRYADDRFGEDDVAGWSTIVGADFRFDLAEHVGFGVAGSVRLGTNARTTAWSGGPQIVLTPFTNANFVIGYNIAGYRDRDFEDSRYSRGGLFATFRLKFDQTSLAALRRDR